jgi:hypothetical protein
MAADQPTRSIRVNRLALVLLTIIGVNVGLVPVVLFLGRPRLLLYVAAASVLGTVFAFLLLQSGRPTPSATSSPRLLEFLLGGLSAVYLPAAGGFFSLVVYWLVYGGAWLVGLLLRWFGLEAQVIPDSIAYYPTAVLAVLLGLGSGWGIEHLQQQLYPDVAGVRSAFYDLIFRGRRRLVGCTAGAVLFFGAALAFFLARGVSGRWPFMLLQGYLLIVSMSLYLVGETPARPSSATDAVESMFRAAGYDITVSPRTGDGAIDPLLANVDLLAHREGRAFAVQVKTQSVDWTAASSLQTAGWTLDDVGEKLGLTAQKVEPLIVLVGAEPDESLRAFSEQEALRVERISSADLVMIRAERGNEDRLRGLARDYLGLSAADPGAGASGNGAGVPGGQP